MNIYRRSVLAAVVGLSVSIPAGALAYPPSQNLLTNPGAEDSLLTGWAGTGWGIDRYDAPGRPTSAEAARVRYGDGTRLFVAAGAAAQISQTVDLSAHAAEIDADRSDVGFGGDFGGQSTTADTSRMTVQHLDAQGALGDPITIGGPTAADRDNQTTLLPCRGRTRVPVGTRAMKVTLTGEGSTAMADALYVLPNLGPQPGLLPLPTVPAQGVGCSTRIPKTDPEITPPPIDTPTQAPAIRRVPKLTSLLSLPAARRCGKPRTLRLKVASSWRSKVKTVTVRARGRDRRLMPTATMTLAGPTRTLLIGFTVTMTDGRVRDGQRRFRACR